MKRTVLLIIFALALALGTSAQRLPENVTPESYDLKFEPKLSNATFSGDVTIHVRLLKPASSIVLNSAESEFQEATIAAGGSVQTASVSLDGKNETATLAVHSRGRCRHSPSLHRNLERSASRFLPEPDFPAPLCGDAI
jgi:hypothetical protein